MINQRLLLLTSILLLVIFSCRQENKAPENPNILLILVDDMGWGDVGYNTPTKVYTPNIDKLAGEGAIFEQHYTMSQCTPTRIACFTGRYPSRFPYDGKAATNLKCFDVGTPTLATMLKEEGYRTYLVGKWHMGSDPADGPNNHGFDESYGSLAGAVGMYDHRYRKGKYERAWHRDHKPIEGDESGVHSTDLLTREAKRIIKKDADSPFFMMLTYHAPHTPLDERGTFVDFPTHISPLDSARWENEEDIIWFNDPEGKIQKEPDPQKRLMLAAINHLDFAIGQVVQELQEQGKLGNTIIMFSSDNGPQMHWPGNLYPDDLKLDNFNQPIPMRGAKLDVWEGGIHVPAFICWNGKIEPQRIQTPVHIIDWFPTIASFSNHEMGDSCDLDGLDLKLLLLYGTKLADRDLYWVWNSQINRWALRYNDMKVVKYGKEQPRLSTDWELYNISLDPKETYNIASEYPEVLFELHKRFENQRAKDSK